MCSRFGQTSTQYAALFQPIGIRRFVYYQRLAAQECAVVIGALCPVAHPLTVAPAVRAKQGDVLSRQAGLQLLEKRFELGRFQDFVAHGRTAKRQFVIRSRRIGSGFADVQQCNFRSGLFGALTAVQTPLFCGEEMSVARFCKEL